MLFEKSESLMSLFWKRAKRAKRVKRKGKSRVKSEREKEGNSCPKFVKNILTL